MEISDSSARGSAAPVNHRAKCVDQLQEQDHAGSRICEYDRPRPVPRVGSHYWWRGRRIRPWDAMAGTVAAHDLTAQARHVDSKLLYADFAGAVVLSARA